MGAPRRKNIIASRRRVEDEGEEEDGSLISGVEDDSSSEASVISDADDDADAEASDASDEESMEQINPKVENISDRQPGESTIPQKTASPKKTSLGTIMHDTEAMMNGLKFSGDVDEGEEINFEDLGKENHGDISTDVPLKDSSGTVPSESLGEKRRREHEEYKKKQNANPAFVPNRGEFFMHDHRSAAPGQNGFRPFGRGRVRARGGTEGSSAATR